MTVTGYLALYTTLMGWQQYESLWGIAVGSGLIYLPFVGIILKSTALPFTSMGAKDAAQIALRRATLNVLIALLVITFAAMPTVNLDPKVLHFQPFCTKNAKEATPGNTGTTYDNMPVPTGVKVPVFWYIVMAVSNGITHAAETGLGCSPIDYRALHTQLNTSKITDPQLKKEVTDFYQYCYEPALSDYVRHKMNDTQDAQVKQSIQKNGESDIAWLGSQTFLNVSGFYDTRHSEEPVKGFAFVPARDFQDAQVDTPKYGKPDCKSWWSDPANGLNKRLKDNLPPGLLQTLWHLGSPQKAQEEAIKNLVSRSMLRYRSFDDIERGYESLDNNTGGALSRYASKVGVEYEGLGFYPKLHLIQNALPVIQATVLFALYAFLGLGMPFSSFRISFCITAAVIIFSVIFCSYIWHVTQWLDNYLIEALYANKPILPGSGLLSGLLAPPDPNKMFVEMIIGAMYLALPLLWLMVMGWVGFQAGSLVSGVMAPPTGAADDAGQSAKGLTTTAVKMTGGLLLK